MFIPRARLVFVTRYRVFVGRHLDCMEQITRDVRADSGTGLAEFGGGPERVHLPVRFRPLSRLARSLKGVSSRRLRQEFPDLRRHYWRANRLWSGSYFASTSSSRTARLTGLTSVRLHHWPEGRRTGGQPGSGCRF